MKLSFSLLPYNMRIIFGEFACGKLIAGFYIADFVPRAIEHAQIEIKMVDFILVISA